MKLYRVSWRGRVSAYRGYVMWGAREWKGGTPYAFVPLRSHRRGDWECRTGLAENVGSRFVPRDQVLGWLKRQTLKNVLQ